MLHRDRVRVRIVRYDRKGRPEGRVLDILERKKAPIIGRLLHEGGQWLVAPEDRRYGQDMLIPEERHRQCRGGAGRLGRTDRAAVAAFAAGGPRGRGAGRDRRSRHGDRDRGAQVRGAAPLQPRDAGAGRGAARQDPPRRPQAPHRPDRRAAGHDRRRGRTRLRRRRLLRAVQARPRQDGVRRLAPDRRHRRREPLRQAGRAARRGRLRARHLGLLPAPRDPDAAGEAVQRPVLAEPRCRALAMVCDMVVDSRGPRWTPTSSSRP